MVIDRYFISFLKIDVLTIRLQRSTSYTEVVRCVRFQVKKQVSVRTTDGVGVAIDEKIFYIREIPAVQVERFVERPCSF